MGIHIKPDLRRKTHIEPIVAKANKILGKTSLVRPDIEFVSTVWSQYFLGDIYMLEKEQKRATRIPFELRGFVIRREIKCLGHKLATR